MSFERNRPPAQFTNNIRQFQEQQNPHVALCFKLFKWIPVLFISAVLAWSYYAYVIQLCFMTVETIAERVILIVLYHLFFSMFLWAYFQTIFTQIGVVPKKFRIPLADLEKLAKATSEEQQKRILEGVAQDLPIANCTHTGAYRFCDRCQVIKPDRTHHCSVCGVCVLKFDHHCPWINNCVNFNNYKFFVLFLGYALLYCIYVALSSVRYFLQFWKGELDGGVGRFHIVFLFFVAGMFAISLVSLFGYHIYLVLKNRTTLEAFRAPLFRGIGPDKNGFNLGRYNNFLEVFGENKRMWLLPVSTSMGNGVQFMTKYAQLHQHHQDLNRLDEVAEEGSEGPVSASSPAMTTVINMNGGSVGAQGVGVAGESVIQQKPLNGVAVDIPMETRVRPASTSVSLKMHDDDDDDVDEDQDDAGDVMVGSPTKKN